MKQLINRYFIGFVFVLGLILIPSLSAQAIMDEELPDDSNQVGGSTTTSVPCVGADCWGATVTTFNQSQIINTRTNKMVFILNLDKKVYEPGEPVTVIAGVESPSCGNATRNVILEGQISGQTNHYTIINQNIKGGYGIYGSRMFTPPFQAPAVPGDYVMNIKAYVKRNGWFYAGPADTNPSSKTSIVVMEQNIPYSVVAPKVEQRSETLSCATPCSGTYTVANANTTVSNRFTTSDSFTFPFCGGTSTVTMNKTAFMPGEQIKITSAGKGMMVSGCPTAEIRGLNSSSASDAYSSMKISGGAMSFPAFTRPGAYSINFGIPVEDEYGNIKYDYNIYTMNYRVGTTVNSCNVFTTQNECSAQSGCSWNTACNAPSPISVKIWANGKNPESIEKSGNNKTRDVNVTWDSSPNAVDCKCTYGPENLSCGSGIGRGVRATGNPYTLAETKTFTVTCSDK